jgi:hypothetical protein
MPETPNDTHAAALPPPRRSWWKAATLGAVLFLSGLFIGGGLTLIALKRRADEFRARPDLLSQRMMERMQTELALTDKQAEEIDKIFEDAHKEASEMRRRSRAQAQAFFREFQAKVAQVLTPAQQEQWEEWFRKARDRAMKDRWQGGPREENGARGDGESPGRGFRQRPPSGHPEPPIGPPPPGIPEHHFNQESDPAGPDDRAAPQEF